MFFRRDEGNSVTAIRSLVRCVFIPLISDSSYRQTSEDVTIMN